jgi:large subunit ribosomal protein L31
MFADEPNETTEVAEASVETTEKETETKAEAQEEIRQSKAEKSNKGEGFKLLPYFENAKVVCACGNTFTTGSTKEEIRVEICSNCHPFFTGQEKFVDTEGRVERFKRMESSKQESKPKKQAEKKESSQPKTLREMLQALENH